MPVLTTPMVKIAQSGPCADGRTIDPQWLRDMAETYDPSVYRAKIWPDHIRFGNTYGTVLDLAMEEDKGVVSLFASMAVNAQYVWDNQYDQRLSFSIEVGENFAGSGKAYLVGLGITDSPASLGTDELKFSRRVALGGQSGARVFAGAPIDSTFLSQPDDAEPAAPGWFTRFIKKFSSEDPSMDPKQLEAFSARLDGLEGQLKDIKQTVDGAFAGRQASPESGMDTAGATTPPANADAAPAPQTDVMRDSFDAALEPVLDRLKAIEERFAAAKPGVPVPDSAGPADDKSPVL